MLAEVKRKSEAELDEARTRIREAERAAADAEERGAKALAQVEARAEERLRQQREEAARALEKTVLAVAEAKAEAKQALARRDEECIAREDAIGLEHARALAERCIAHDDAMLCMRTEIGRLEAALCASSIGSSSVVSKLQNEIDEIRSEAQGERTRATQALEDWRNNALLRSMRHAFGHRLAQTEQMAAAMGRLHANARFLKELGSAFASICEREARAAARGAFGRWTDVVRQRMLCRRGLMVMRMSSMRWALTSWMISAIHLMVSRDLVGGAARRWAAARVGAAWRTWATAAASAAAERRQMRLAFSEWLGASLRSTFVGWMVHTATKRTLSGAVNGMLMRMLRASFVQWAAVREASRAWDETVAWAGSVLSRIMSPEMRLRQHAFNALQEGAALRNRLRATATALLYAERLKALRTWQSAARDGLERRMTLRRGAEALRNGGRLRALNAWKSHVEQGRALRRRSHHHLLRQAPLHRAYLVWMALAICRVRALAALRRAVGSLRNRLLRMGFAMLVEHAVALQAATRRLSAAAGEWRGVGLRKCLLEWVELSIERTIMMNALTRLRLQTLCRGFSTFRACVRKQARLHGLMKGTLMRLQHQALCQAFNSMRAVVALLSEKRAVLRRALTRLCRRSTHMAFGAWAKAAAETTIKRTAMLRAAQAIRHRAALVALHTWREGAAARSEAWRALRKSASILRANGLYRALHEWKAAASELAEEVRVRRAAAKSWHGSTRLKGWKTWKQAAAASSESRHRLTMAMREWQGASFRSAFSEWAQSLRQSKAARRAVECLRLRGRRAGFTTWSHAVSSAREWRRQAGAAIGSVMSPMLRLKRHALNTLREASVELGGLKRCARGLLKGRRQRALRTWVLRVAERKSQLDDDLGRLLVMRECVAAIRFSGLRRGLSTWMERNAESMSQRRALRAAGMAWKHGGLQSTFTSWLQMGDVQKRAGRILGRVRLLSISRAFNSLCDYVVGVLHGKSRLRRAMARTVHRSVFRAIRSWREMVRARRSGDAAMHRAVRMVFFGGLTKAMNSWRQLAAARGGSFSILRRAATAFRSADLQRGYATWADLATARSGVARKLESVAAEWLDDTLSNAMTGWLLMCSQRHGMRRAMGSIRMRRARRGLEAWMEAIDAATQWRRRFNAVFISFDATKWPLHWAMRAWRAMHERRKALDSAASALRRGGRTRRLFRRWNALSAKQRLTRRTATLVASAAGHAAKRRLHRMIASGWHQWKRRASAYRIEASRRRRDAIDAVWRRALEVAEDDVEEAAYVAVDFCRQLGEQRTVTAAAIAARVLRPELDETTLRAGLKSRSRAELPTRDELPTAKEADATTARLQTPARARSSMRGQSLERPSEAPINPEPLSRHAEPRHDETGTLQPPALVRVHGSDQNLSPSRCGSAVDAVTRAVEGSRSPSPKRRVELMLPSSGQFELRDHDEWTERSPSPVRPAYDSRSMLSPDLSLDVAERIRRALDGAPDADAALLRGRSMSERTRSRSPRMPSDCRVQGATAAAAHNRAVYDAAKTAACVASGGSARPAVNGAAMAAAASAAAALHASSPPPALTISMLEAGERWSTNASRRNVSPAVLAQHPDHIVRSFAKQSKSALQPRSRSQQRGSGVASPPRVRNPSPMAEAWSPSLAPARTVLMPCNRARSTPSSPSRSTSRGRDGARDAAAGQRSLKRSQMEAEKRGREAEWQRAMHDAEVRCRAAGIDPAVDASQIDPALLRTIADSPGLVSAASLRRGSSILSPQAILSPARQSLNEKFSTDAWR